MHAFNGTIVSSLKNRLIDKTRGALGWTIIIKRSGSSADGAVFLYYAWFYIRHTIFCQQTSLGFIVIVFLPLCNRGKTMCQMPHYKNKRLSSMFYLVWHTKFVSIFAMIVC
jgi:hypothetical protein